MKITFLTPTLELYGGNIVMLRHAEYLVKQGHQVKIITTTKPIQLDIPKGVEVVQYRHNPIRYFDYFTLQRTYFRKIISLIDDCDFLITIYTPLLPAAIKAKQQKQLKAKIVHVLQDPLNAFWAGRFICNILRSSEVAQEVTGVITVSTVAADEYHQLTGRTAEFIPIGISLDIFKPRPIKKEPYLLFVGRPIPPKGFPLFKEAYLAAKKDHPELKAVVAGVTAPEEDGISYVSKRQGELAEVYNRALIYVNSSLAESFPAPPLEAMASGTACVLVDVGGIKEYARDRENCLFVPYNDQTKLTEAVKTLLSDEALRHQLEQAGPATAAEYGWPKANQHLLRYLQDRL